LSEDGRQPQESTEESDVSSEKSFVPLEKIQQAALQCGSLTNLLQMLLDEMLIADIRELADLMAVEHQELERPQVIEALIELSKREDLTRDVMEATVVFAKITALRELMLNLGLGSIRERKDIVDILQEILIQISENSLQDNIDLHYSVKAVGVDKGTEISCLDTPKDVDVAVFLELEAMEAYKQEERTLREKLEQLLGIESQAKLGTQLTDDQLMELETRPLIEAKLNEIQEALSKYKI
jgi:hypothetical protein